MGIFRLAIQKFRTFLFFLLLLSTSCVRNLQQKIVVVTSTPETSSIGDSIPTYSTFQPNDVLPTANLQTTVVPTPQSVALQVARQYIVQTGDTLSGIAAANGVSLETLIAINNLIDPNILEVGQVINLPELPSEMSPNFRILPDSRFVRGPGSSLFDVAVFISQQSGYIRNATDTVDDQMLTAAQVVERVAQEYSIDPRLLLTLLEYRAGWLTQTDITDTLKIYSMELEPSPAGFDRRGLYKQLAWAANQLNRGYYGWRERAWTTLEFEDGNRILYAPDLNAGTIGLQYFLSQKRDYLSWSEHVGENGFYQTYVAYFGDPFISAIDPLIPPNLAQPELTLPFPAGQTWFFTGGFHGGWGSGSAWSAIDFAPPDERPDYSPACYVSDYWATAVAPGIIVRSEDGMVILDLDMDWDETTGWTILYLHIASDGRVPVGTVVQSGDLIGHPSCEGGFSNGTHMHIARRYNGEWIPAWCDQCRPDAQTPPFVLSGWSVVGLTGQEYQGYLVNGVEQRIAEQSRLTPINHISW